MDKEAFFCPGLDQWDRITQTDERAIDKLRS